MIHAERDGLTLPFWLTHSTAEHMAAQVVQQDLLYALTQGKKVVVLHDGGIAQVDFDDILAVCPTELKELGLMDDLATEWHYEPAYRNVSIHLIWHRIACICSQENHHTATQEAPTNTISRALPRKAKVSSRSSKVAPNVQQTAGSDVPPNDKLVLEDA